jgi:hypothetical protein
VIKIEYLGWWTLNPITNKYQLILSLKMSHGSICCILQLLCLQTWILFTQVYAMAFWMKTITKSIRFCLLLYLFVHFYFYFHIHPYCTLECISTLYIEIIFFNSFLFIYLYSFFIFEVKCFIERNQNNSILSFGGVGGHKDGGQLPAKQKNILNP